MTEKQKFQAILDLLTDKTWLKIRETHFENEEEKYGALVMLTYLFKEANKLERK